jgi:hypothetical protein
MSREDAPLFESEYGEYTLVEHVDGMTISSDRSILGTVGIVLFWSIEDPFTVGLDFRDSDRNLVRRQIARELLHNGFSEKVGQDGDVGIEPISDVHLYTEDMLELEFRERPGEKSSRQTTGYVRFPIMQAARLVNESYDLIDDSTASERATEELETVNWEE